MKKEGFRRIWNLTPGTSVSRQGSLRPLTLRFKSDGETTKRNKRNTVYIEQNDLVELVLHLTVL